MRTYGHSAAETDDIGIQVRSNNDLVIYNSAGQHSVTCTLCECVDDTFYCGSLLHSVDISILNAFVALCGLMGRA